MKFCEFDYKLVVAFVTIVPFSSQYHTIPDLPWKKLNSHERDSDIEASNVTFSRFDKSAELKIVTIHKSSLQKDYSTFYMQEEWGNVSEFCREKGEEFGNVSVQLIFCFVQHARPITVCRNCSEKYIEFYNVYKNICISTDDKQMEECQKQLLNRDKLNVVQKTCDFTLSLWTDAHCTNCFEKVNGSLTTTLNDETEKFLNISGSVYTCFGDSSSKVNSATITKNESVCSSCRNVYNSLRDDYAHLKHSYPDSVCMDLTDIMNETRDLWSRHYHCELVIVSDPYVFILATFFAILVALFYSGFRFIARAQNTKIIGQKRFVSRYRSNSNSGQVNLNSLH